jgi:hypothetical protein
VSRFVPGEVHVSRSFRPDPDDHVMDSQVVIEDLVRALAQQGVQGGMIVVVGACGSGKSHLARELVRSVEDAGHEVAWMEAGSVAWSQRSADLVAELADARVAVIDGIEEAAVPEDPSRQPGAIVERLMEVHEERAKNGGWLVWAVSTEFVEDHDEIASILENSPPAALWIIRLGALSYDRALRYFEDATESFDRRVRQLEHLWLNVRAHGSTWGWLKRPAAMRLLQAISPDARPERAFELYVEVLDSEESRHPGIEAALRRFARRRVIEEDARASVDFPEEGSAESIFLRHTSRGKPELVHRTIESFFVALEISESCRTGDLSDFTRTTFRWDTRELLIDAMESDGLDYESTLKRSVFSAGRPPDDRLETAFGAYAQLLERPWSCGLELPETLVGALGASQEPDPKFLGYVLREMHELLVDGRELELSEALPKPLLEVASRGWECWLDEDRHTSSMLDASPENALVLCVQTVWAVRAVQHHQSQLGGPQQRTFRALSNRIEARLPQLVDRLEERFLGAGESTRHQRHLDQLRSLKVGGVGVIRSTSRSQPRAGI